MSRFVNDANGVVVSVADEKDDRFGEGWTKESASKTAPKKTEAK